jgi:hypothetical protein
VLVMRLNGFSAAMARSETNYEDRKIRSLTLPQSTVIERINEQKWY